MHELYSEKDLEQLSAQLKRRFFVIGAVLAAVAALVVFSMVRRIEWLTTVSVFIFGAVAVFSIDLFCMPLIRYRRLLVSALSGRTHVETLEYSGEEAESSLVDGVVCRGLLFLGEPDKHGIREQRYYWDAEQPLPPFRPGETVTLKYTGRNIIGYEA